MEILSIATKIPDHSKAYVFGSVLTSIVPNDFDLLIVYDQSRWAPGEAYAKHAELFEEIKIAFGLPVHQTLLTDSEAKSVDIIERTCAVPLDKALRELTRHRLRLHPN